MLFGMGFMQRAAQTAAALGLAEQVRATTEGTVTSAPLREPAGSGVTVSEAATLPAVYRSLDILATAAEQTPFYVERDGRRLTPSELSPSSVLRRPCVDLDNDEFVQQLVLSLACTGNAYWRKLRKDGRLLGVELLNPHLVAVGKNARTGRRVYGYEGKQYGPEDVQHLTRLRLPGQDKGLGPIQSARDGLRLGLDERAFASQWFSTSGAPSGILRTDQVISGDDAARARRMWNHQDPETGEALPVQDNPTRVRVLGKGLNYEQLLLSPSDALWLDAMNFTATEVARLFGIPPSLLYLALEGNSMTYSNVEQQWLEFSRFTLTGYLRKIENALTKLSPAAGRVKFNLDALLRSDTLTRYRAHETGIRAGFLTPDEARAHEGREPLAPEQIEQLQAVRPSSSSTPREDGTA